MTGTGSRPAAPMIRRLPFGLLALGG